MMVFMFLRLNGLEAQCAIICHPKPKTRPGMNIRNRGGFRFKIAVFEKLIADGHSASSDSTYSARADSLCDQYFSKKDSH